MTNSHVKKLEMTGMKMCSSHILRDHVRNYTPETEGREYHREVLESKTEVVWTREENDKESVRSQTLEAVPNGRRRGKPKQIIMDAVSKNDKVDQLFVYQNIIKIIEFVCFNVILRGGYFCIIIYHNYIMSYFNCLLFQQVEVIFRSILLYIYFKFKMYFICI